MSKPFGAALFLLVAGLLRAEPPVYTSFNADRPQVHIARYSAHIPTFGFGPSASFDNPALLAGVYGQEIGFSLQDVSHPFSMALSYSGKFLENAALGGGVSVYSRDGYLENHSVFSFASSGDNIDFGANIKFMLASKLDRGGYDQSLYAMDVDLGFLLGSASRIYAGAVVFNILSTPFLHTRDFSVSPERALKVQAGGFLDGQRATAVFAEARIDSMHNTKFSRRSYGGGVETAFFKDRSLKLRAGVMSGTNSGDDQVLSAVRFEFPVRSTAIKTEYGLNVLLNTVASASAADRLSHHIQFAFGLGGREDYTPPVVTLSADNPAFTPDGDNKSDKVNILIRCEDNPGGSGIKKWALTFCRKAKNDKLEIIKAYTGIGLPPRIITWDGRDSGKDLLDKGVYFYQFRAIDRANNATDTPPQPVRIE